MTADVQAEGGGWLSKRPAARRLIVAGLLGGVGATVASVLGSPWPLIVLAGWNTAAVVFLVLVWLTVLRFTPEETERLATTEDPSHTASGAVLVSASTASLVGVIFGLHTANQSTGGRHAWLIAAVIGGVVCSWLVVHTVYMLRYAHLYYGHTKGGITFPGTDEPDYKDFAYLSFTLGMTFQVSDNDLEARNIRHAALLHCLLSYLFGTVIIATSINVVAQLVS